MKSIKQFKASARPDAIALNKLYINGKWRDRNRKKHSLHAMDN